MDMDASQHWLSFSLSHQPCTLFEAFSPPHHAAGAEEDGGGKGEFSVAFGPKLEDFLGGGNCGGSAETSAETDCVIYDSDLKTVAVGFIRGAAAAGLPEQLTPANSAMVAPESRKAFDTFGQRTSIYRGVTRHRWTGRYEAHLWDNSCRREGQSRKGRQVYLGGYDKEEKAARAYDLAALKYWGPSTTTNFPVSNYERELEEMKNMTRQEFVASLRRKSSGFSRGASIYRGVTRHHQHGRWQARIGRVAGNKDLYLGTFSTQEEAAEAYDVAAIKFRGLNAVTNFDMSRYDVKSIANLELPIGCMAGRASKALEASSSTDTIMGVESRLQMDGHDASSSSFSYSHLPVKQDQDCWSLLAYHHHQQQQQNNGQAPGFGVYASGVNMDCTATSSGVMGNLGWSNGILQQELEETKWNSNTASSAIPYATPIAFGGSFEGSSYAGNWIPPSSASYYQQAAKPNVAVFQTPIFGME